MFFVYVFTSSCKDSVPEQIISQDDMVPVLRDLHLANGYTSSMYGDSANSKIASIYQALYKKYDIDSITLRRSISFYAQSPEKLEVIYTQVQAQLLSYKSAEQKRIAIQDSLALRKRQAEEAIVSSQARVAADRQRILEGKYDFRLSEYRSEAEDFLQIRKVYPIKDTSVSRPGKSNNIPDTTRIQSDTLKTSLLRRRMLLKKEKRKNDLPAERFR